MTRLARWCFRHRRLTLGGWVVALLVFVGASLSVGFDYSTEFTVPDGPSTQARALLEHEFSSSAGEVDQIVLESTSPLTADPIRSDVEGMLAKVRGLPHVARVAGPYGDFGTSQVSPDKKIAYATVTFDTRSHDLPRSAVRSVIDTAQSIQGARLRVALGGQAIQNIQPQQASGSATLGIVLALIVLGLAFGALFAAVTPIVTALFAIGIGYAITGLLSHALPVVSFAPILGVLIGLAVGIDYALFIVTRHRAGLRAGHSVEDSTDAALDTAGRAVFFAGLTVAIALLGQFVLGLSFLDSVALTATVTVALTMLASLTLLPALLGFIGSHALSRRERRRLRETGPHPEEATSGWHRWARRLERHRVPAALVSLPALIVLALPALGLQLSLDDAGSDPASSTTRQAYDLMATGFGPGINGPLQLVATIDSPADKAAFTRVVQAAAAQPGVASATPVRSTPDGTAATAALYPTTAPSAPETPALLNHLRDDVVPKAEAGTGLTVLIGGTTATQADFSRALASRLPAFLAIVAVVAFLLLLLVFRSLLIPLLASILNLLSIAAALGGVTAVVGRRWGASLLGISDNTQVEVFLPVIMISVLFGVSMDYHVFLVSRIHEHWSRTHDSRAAVTHGLAVTGKVITAAASIMILVFLSFLLNDGVIVQQFGIGLAAAVVIDAFLIRTLLVPALLHLFGPAAWWLPRWLDRLLPHVRIEGSSSVAASEGSESEPTHA
ncbi:MMPL family transporter [Amycolatopsis rhabdoformis]|uniref:MMPL family transporter n=1 Tax=Amycolatopsis rhabdoformis TaxID=1448059 RepID=A0ABZ1IE38_9PSEU|nr:MMPL family transporter [Amycolatopsis rhabdoformis]WSE32349.1 MMPL family transporter [Amycolatopsis rhabdoformis]